MVPLTPTHSQNPPILPIINTNPSQAGDEFSKRGSRSPHQSTYNLVERISDVLTNGKGYNGSIFDSHGTRLA